MEDQAHLIRFIAEECERQRVGPERVADMYDAWMHMCMVSKRSELPLTLGLIEALGDFVEPFKNRGGFRNVPVYIGGSAKLNASLVWPALSNLILAWNEGRINPQVFYEEYEEIHPFVDGNGRTGKILFNYLNGTLENPVMPENRKGWVIP